MYNGPMPRQYGSREDARRRLAGATASTASVITMRNIVRRMGVTLNAALDCCISELIAHNMVNTAASLRDELKPLCDALVHFDLTEEDDDGDEA